MRDTEWFYRRKWGVTAAGCRHIFLEDPDQPANRDRGITSWTQCVADLDAELLADELAELGAGYLIFCLNQTSRYFAVPNETYDRITGYLPGEACSEDDVVERLYAALAARDIDLLLTVSCDGPSRDPIGREAFGGIAFGDPDPFVTDAFVEKWAAVIRECSLRYGGKVKGWWLDGCYNNIGYTDAKRAALSDACRAGNPQAIVATNIHGLTDEYAAIIDKVRGGCPSDDYTFGEMWRYEDLPYAPFIGHCRWHLWSWFGATWPMRDERFREIPYTPEYLRDYTKAVHDRGGVVTFNVSTFREGRMFPEQKALLARIREAFL